MSAICCGGVCIPYSAIVPFLLLFLQFFARPLAKLGLLPAPIAKRLGISATGESDAGCSEESCCDEKKPPSRGKRSKSKKSVVTSDVIMREVADASEFQNLVDGSDVVIVKFTAEWCKPCKAIQPFFLELATKYASSGNKKVVFGTVDVDELDEISSKYKVAMMPTFLAINNSGEVLDSMSGSNEGKLEMFVKKIVE